MFNQMASQAGDNIFRKFSEKIYDDLLPLIKNEKIRKNKIFLESWSKSAGDF